MLPPAHLAIALAAVPLPNALFGRADGPPLTPLVILLLCLAAGVGTMLLLPRRGGASLRKVGGAVLLLAAVAFAAMLLAWSARAASGMLNPYFWAFSAIALFSSMRVVTHRRPVYSALYFVLTVFATAGLFVLLWAEFMAAALVLIYAGAILVAYVFVIMLAAEASPALPADQTEGIAEVLSEHDTVSRDPIVASVVGFALMGLLLFVIVDRFQPPPRASATSQSAEMAGVGDVAAGQTGAPGAAAAAVVEPDYPVVQGATQELGEYLFGRQLVGLQVAAVILTLSVIGAIVIARRQVLIPGRPAGAGPPPETRVGPVVSGIDDDPHAIPIYGTRDGRVKAYPET